MDCRKNQLVSKLKDEDNRCLKYSSQCCVFGIDNLEHPERMKHYNKLKYDSINLENMKYPGGSRQIGILEENNKGVLSINVFEEFDFNGAKSIAIYRRTKVRNAKYHCNLL